ncbi:PEGA domain-containing protein, partial [Spirochaetota bacterium]
APVATPTQTPTITPTPTKTPIPITDVVVKITSAPGKAELWLNNKMIGHTPLSVKLKLGTYQLVLQKHGYKTLTDHNFTVDYRKRLTMHYNLEKIKTHLTVTSSPGGAAIKINGQTAGKAPVKREGLEFGTYTVRAELAGYTPTEKAVIIDTDKPYTINLTLTKETGSFSVDSDPKGAVIFIDNISYGSTPKEIKKIAAGLHTLRLVKEGFSTVEKEIEVTPAEADKKYFFSLTGTDGYISIKTFPDSADCYINGTSAGKSPLVNYKIKPGVHNLSIKKAGYDDYTQVIKINPGEAFSREIVLAMKKAMLSITSFPEGALVIIQGKKYGYTPFITDYMQPGEITVNLIKDGYLPYAKTATLNAGVRNEITVSLQAAVKGVMMVEKGTLSVTSAPSTASVYITNALIGNTPFLYNLNPGTYAVRITKKNYIAWSGKATIASKAVAKLNVSLASKMIRVSITSVPPGAVLALNNKPYGKTPVTRNIPFNNYVIKLSMPGYNPVSDYLKPTGTAKVFSKSYTLSKVVRKYTFNSTPQSAEVILNGRVIGITPFEYTGIRNGTYTFLFRKAGYRDSSVPVTFKDGSPNKITASLQAQRGSLLVETTPPSANVHIGGRFAGKSGQTLNNVPTGYHRIKISLYGYYDINTQVRILDNKLTRYKAALQEKPKGNLKVDSTPQGARIFLNGKQTGMSPVLLKGLPEDRYHLKLKLKGYKSFRSYVNVTGHQTEHVNVKLVEGSDSCCSISLLGKPAFWYVMSIASFATAGYNWYREEKALKDGRIDLRDCFQAYRNGFAIAGLAFLGIGIVVSF